ncbi:hypothetical protein VP137E351_P0050 [Vibrio phage 137E35-1]|nr:hypothetical protein VP137E351_P0050 [Vibrio phage 137E35-1]CAH9016387.1 hypothetical protein VP230E391_P0050 [Vibrio phage 230E39-1]
MFLTNTRFIARKFLAAGRTKQRNPLFIEWVFLHLKEIIINNPCVNSKDCLISPILK